MSLEELKELSFVLRERGSGTLQVIEHALKPLNIKLSQLRVEMQLGSTEGIKTYLQHSDCVAFISIHAVTKELQNNQLYVIDIENLTINRWFYMISLQGREDGLSELFRRYSDQYNLKL